MSLTIVNATVWDGTELRDGPLAISGDRIAAIGTKPRTSTQVLDAQGGVVVPGFIDAHFHAYAASLDLESMPSHVSFVALTAARRLAADGARRVHAELTLGRGFVVGHG